MFRTFVLAVIAGVACASAAGDVRVFVTSSASGYGLDLLGPQGDGTGTDPYHEDWPIDPFRPTYSTVHYVYPYDRYAYDYYYGYYRAAAYPPIDALSGTADNPILIDAGSGDWGYMWFQFRNEPQGAQVNGFGTIGTLAGQSAPTFDVEFTYYVQNDRGASGRKRFDGYAFPPDYAPWHYNPFTTDQLSSNSILNWGDDPTMMFDHQAGGKNEGWTGVALLGALRGAPSDNLYEFGIPEWAIDYSSGPRPSIGESCFFRIVPEPSSGVLLAVAAMSVWLRARRS
jgi:hypothetical protein